MAGQHKGWQLPRTELLKMEGGVEFQAIVGVLHLGFKM